MASFIHKELSRTRSWEPRSRFTMYWARDCWNPHTRGRSAWSSNTWGWVWNGSRCFRSHIVLSTWAFEIKAETRFGLNNL